MSDRLAPPESEDLWRRLRARGLRRTAQREAVLLVLQRAPTPLSTPLILARGRRIAPGLGVRTVERTLAVLVADGSVDAFRDAHGATVHRLCGAGHHHHLVCSTCGRVVELVECDVGDWAERQASAHDFVLFGHELTVYGRCADCRVARARRRVRPTRRQGARPRT